MRNLLADHSQAEGSPDPWLEAVFEGSRDAIFLSDGKSRFVAVNRAACDLTGYSRDELLKMSIPDLHDEADLHAYRTYHARILGGEEVLSQAAIRRKDGSKVEAEFSNRAITVDGVACMHTTARDVSARVLAEAVLRESETRFRALVEQAGDGFELIDADGRFVDVNGEDCRQKGYTREELLRLTVFDLCPPLTRELFLAHCQARLDGAVMTFETVHRRKDGTLLPVEVRTSNVRLGGSDRTLSLVRDITERKQAEEKIRALNESLEERVAERTMQLEATIRDLESFSYSVSHDLRAPLRAIDGFSKKVADLAGPALDVDCQRMLGVVRQNAVRMGKLIDDLLTFLRTNRGEVRKSAVPMDAMVRSVFAEVVPDAAARERIVFNTTDLPEAWGDSALLRQVWTNLLSNAVKFSAPADPPRIEVTGSMEGGQTVYRVRDNGVGFDMAYVAKLFGVFQRLHGMTEFEGNGVGLALVQRIVVRHGGRVWAEGAVGRGATFSFALPGPAPRGVSPRSGTVPSLSS